MTLLLEVSELSVQFLLRRSTVQALTNVSFTLEQGNVLAIVGEGMSRALLKSARQALLVEDVTRP